jgi:O-antigen ligase
MRIINVELSALFKSFKDKSWAERSYLFMYFGFCFFILFFPIGRAFREIGEVVSVSGLIAYYLFDYKNSQLKKFSLNWLYLLFWGYMLFKVFHSIDVADSWDRFETSIRKGGLLFFVGIECVRGMKDLKRFVVLFCIMGFYEGLDGIYQYISGYDLFKGTAIWGSRLTGSLSTPRVGNLMALVLPPSMAVFFLWKDSWPILQKALLTGIILIPALFLFVGAQARSGYIGYLLACTGLLLFFRGFSWRKTTVILALIIGALFFGPTRTSYNKIINDPRIQEIWPTAIQVFEKSPILGVGIKGFNKGFKDIGLHMPGRLNRIPHPHNIYLQFACETGVIGLGIFLGWIGTYLWWTWKKIRTGWLTTSDTTYWSLVFCFWSAYVGYMGTGISGHNFFKDWWLALSLSILGITVGGCITHEHKDVQNDKPTHL